MFDSNKDPKIVKEEKGQPPFSQEELIQLEKKYKFWPKKKLGQNFIIDRELAQEMVKALNLSPQERVYEIGPGFGAITYFLIQKSSQVIVIEKDKQLANILQEIFPSEKKLKIIQADIQDFLASPPSPGKFIGNPPYSLSSPLIHQLLSLQPRPKKIILLLQKEVGERIMARPPRANRLSIFVQLSGEVKMIREVSKKSFFPQPKVDSVLLEIEAKDSPLAISSLTLINKAFSSPRKTLLNNLVSSQLGKRVVLANYLQQIGIDSFRRPGSLTIENWKNLFSYFQKLKN
jgi:16S rRNA (adenine1518-N6/adenine1519-N6)-dimethyltransferase